MNRIADISGEKEDYRMKTEMDKSPINDVESSALVRPGDRLIISIRFLDCDEFGDEEITHQDLVLEDFLRYAESPDWDPHIVKIDRSNNSVDRP